MHHAILKKYDLAKKKNLREDEEGTLYMTIDELPGAMETFLFKNGWKPQGENDKFYLPVAGKNVAAFDIPFMKEKVNYWGRIHLMQRTLDPAILFMDPFKDNAPPDLLECMRRCGMEGEVAHTAHEDAEVVIKVLRHYYKIKPR
jgi:hypothetical protein